jgi:hypothetical protein
VTHDFEIDLGAAIRKTVLFQMRSAAARLDLTFTILADDGGWLSTKYLIRVEGKQGALESFQHAYQHWARRMAQT